MSRNFPFKNLPKGWKVVKLGEVTLMIRNGLTYKHNEPIRDDALPITRIETIASGNIDMEKVGYVSGLSESQVKKWKLDPGDILMSHINSLAHIGKVAIYEGNPPTLIHGMNLLRIKPNTELIVPVFLFYIFNYYRRIGLFRSMAKKAVNQASINQSQLKNLPLPLPPLEEQKKIAEILGTVDEAIEKVGAEIERTERLKRGLMRRLLTQGVGHTRFKDTPLGKLPESWKVVKLGEVISFTKKPDRIPDSEEIPFIPMEFIPIGKTKIVDYVLKRPEDISSGIYCEKGDILLPKITPSVENGKGGIVEGIPKKFAYATTEVYAIKPDSNQVDRFYLFYFLSCKRTREILASQMTGSTGRQRVPKKAVINLPLPLPPLEEQEKIAEILGVVDERLEVLKEKKEVLRKIKRGLMGDLLTGRRRVKTAGGKA